MIRTVLNPQTPLFREARYLLAEEAAIRDPALYHSVLAAIASGNNTNGGIAGFIGRKSDQITHPLNVLEDCALIAREPDLFRPGRSRYRIVEPLITFYEAIMRKRWAELEIHRAERVWASTRQTFLTQVVGPHFESLSRAFTLESGDDLFTEQPPRSDPRRSTTPPTAPRSRSTWSHWRRRRAIERAASCRWVRPNGGRSSGVITLPVSPLLVTYCRPEVSTPAKRY